MASTSSFYPNVVNTPPISLPKGGGTVKAADENFHADVFTGTATLEIPLQIPEARGLTPHLSINYSSSSGNGLLGMGVQLSESSIYIKTNRRLAKYDESDVYCINGNTELVPSINLEGVYFERVQSSFHKIEKLGTGNNVSWRVTGNDNTIYIYGDSSNSRIYDTQDSNKIYKWLLSSVTDSRGNKIQYSYKSFDSSNNQSNRYLFEIHYGNYFYGKNEHFAFKLLVDYGQVSYQELDNKTLSINLGDNTKFPLDRSDIITSYRSGFLIETRYLVRNIWFFHNFINDSKTNGDCLTQRICFEYDTTPSPITTLKSVKYYKFSRNLTSYDFKCLPPIELAFTKFNPASNPSFAKITQIKEGNQNVPLNVPLHFLDLNGEGIPGIIYREADTLYYYEAQGNGTFTKVVYNIKAPTGFTDPYLPMNIVSLEADSNLQIVSEQNHEGGYYAYKQPDFALPFIPFQNQSLSDVPRNVVSVDLNGDNREDHVFFSQQGIHYTPSLGLQGMEDRQLLPNPTSVAFEHEPNESPYCFYGFADVWGDGLAHRIKIVQGNMSVWPNLGFGKFGDKVDILINNFNIEKEEIDLRHRLHLIDINGDGCVDIVLIYSDKIKIFLNHLGKGFTFFKDVFFGEGITYSHFDTLQFSDINGDGGLCLVLSKNTPTIEHYYAPLGDADTVKGQISKAYLLSSINNNMGVTTDIIYKSSLKDYLADKKNNQTWETKMPFPSIVIDKTVITDYISNATISNQYAYRNGYYDAKEHSFLGFGMVSCWDSPLEKQENTPPPTLKKYWFHLGTGTDEAKTKACFYQGDTKAPVLPFYSIPTNQEVTQEELYALVGKEIHQEMYDNSHLDCPYFTKSTCYTVLNTQEATTTQKGVFRVYANESIGLNYEQQKDDPQVSHDIVLETNQYNQALQTAHIVYPRRVPLIEEQSKLYCSASVNKYVNQDVNGKARWLGILMENQSFEITGLETIEKGLYFSFDKVAETLKSALSEPLSYSDTPTIDTVQARLLSWQKHIYWNNEQQTSILNSQSDLPSILLPHHSETIVLDATNVAAIYEGKIKDDDLKAVGYVKDNEYWWQKSEVSHFSKSPEKFYQLIQSQSPWELVDKNNYLYVETTFEYDDYALFLIKTQQRLNDSTSITNSAEIDYRTLSAYKMIDENENISEVLTDELGFVIASAIYEKQGVVAGDMPLASYVKRAIPSIANIVDAPLVYLQKAGSYFYYEFPAYKDGNWLPACSITLTREVFKTAEVDEIQRSIVYNDGFGRVIEAKKWAGNDPKDVNKARWLTSGKVVYNAKGQVYAAYLPYFSNTYQYDKTEVTRAIKTLPPPTTFEYDAIGRTVRTHSPKGFFSMTNILNAWETQHFDENDTLLDSTYYKSKAWENNPAEKDAIEKDAIEKAAKFYDTPSTTVIDTLGRVVLAIQDNAEGKTEPISFAKNKLTSDDIDASKNPALFITWQSYDIQGRVLKQADPRFYEENRKGGTKKYNFEHFYSLAGGALCSKSADAGTITSFSDVHGNVVFSWDALGNKHIHQYDNLQRPTIQYVQKPNEEAKAIQVIVYGTEAKANTIGKPVKVYDNGGLVLTPAYNFEGYPTQQVRQFRKEYKTEANWTPANIKEANTFLENELFTNTIEYNALGKPVRQTFPDGSVTTWKYGVMGNCIASTVSIDGKERTIVMDSQLNANGQLESVVLGNGVHTNHKYDALTLHLSQISATRKNGDKTETLQKLDYTYDPTGLITLQKNEAMPTQYFDNKSIEPETYYQYDALYRLTTAGGRAQMGRFEPALSPNERELSFTPNYTNNKAQAIENYTERYEYDKSNNLTKLVRTASSGYTRNYTIAERSNQLVACTIGNQHSTNFHYDAAGQMLNLNGEGSLPLTWNTQGNIAQVILIDRS
ncbi:MAG: SpvB/TcaC N-terminal domain-containing protein, partial [Bacteroidia bacterium]